MSISFSGLASGLDTSSWITSLTALKQAKVETLQEEKENVLLSRETLNKIKSFFSSFRSVLEKVTDTKFGVANMDIFAQKLATSSNTSIVTASATTEAEEATYDVLVDKLATTTQAMSSVKVMSTITQTVTASLDTKLSDLGVKTGQLGVTVNGAANVIEIETDDTLGSFIEKLRGVGVNASYNEKTGIFTVNADDSAFNDTLTTQADGTVGTGIVEALNLREIGGYESTFLQTSTVETIVSAATGVTELGELGEINEGDIVVKVNGTEHTIWVDNNMTLQEFIDALQAIGVDAELKNTGELIIRDAEITDPNGTGIIDALGLSSNVNSNTQIATNLQNTTIVTTVTSATNDTKLGELDGWDEANSVLTVINGEGVTTNITMTSDMTLGELVTALNTAGLNASLSTDGTLNISGGMVSGAGAGTLGINTGGGTITNITLDGATLFAKTTTYATGDTTFKDLGITNFDGNIKDSSGNVLATIDSINENSTLNDFFTLLGTHGISASISDGKITLNSADGNIVTGAIADALGIGTESTTLTTGNTITSKNPLTWMTTASVSTTTTFADLGIDAASKVLEIRNREGGGLVTTITCSNTENIGQLFTKLEEQGITGSLNDGVITLTSESKYVTGTLADALGIGVESSTIPAVTTITSKNPLTYATISTVVSGETTFEDMGIDAENKVLEVRSKADNSLVTTIACNNTENIGQLFTKLAEQEITATLSNNAITLDSDENYVSGTLAEALGIGVLEQVSIPTIVTLTMTATEATTFAELGVTGSLTATVKRFDYSGVFKTITVSSSDTIADFITKLSQNSIRATMVDGKLESDSAYNYYISGDVADLLGIEKVELSCNRYRASNSNLINVEYNSAVTGPTRVGENEFMQSVSQIDTSAFTSLSSVDSDTKISYSTYKISTTDDLIRLRELENARKTTSCTFILANDIDMTGISWDEEIGSSYFEDIFDGNGYKITNLSGSKSLFGRVSEATIKNLGLQDISINTSDTTGCLARETHLASIENCFVSGTVAARYIGGLIGESFYGSTINNCHTSLDITSSTSYNANVAGLIYISSNSIKLSNSYAEGTLTDTASYAGLIYKSTASGSLENVASYCDFSVGSGSIIGYLDCLNAPALTLTIKNAYTSGDNAVAGIIDEVSCYTPQNNLTIENVNSACSDAIGSVTVDGTSATNFKLSDYGINSGYIKINKEDGTTVTINVDSTKTLGEFREQLKSYDSGLIFEPYGAHDAPPVLYISQSLDCEVSIEGLSVISMSETRVMNSVTAPITYTTTTESETTTLCSNETIGSLTCSTTVNVPVTLSTKLGDIDGHNIGNGEIAIHKSDGTVETITISATQTLGDFFDQISAYGFAGSIDSSGNLTITATDNSYIETITESTPTFIEAVTRRDTSGMTSLASVDETVALTGGTYSISTTEELAKLATMTNNGLIDASTEFVLANNIDLSAYSTGTGWTAIGNNSNAFQATFDGNGYEISNLYINNASSSEHQGLFGNTNGTIKNLGVVDYYVSGSNSAGGLVGYADSNATINNCYATGSVYGSENVGGLVGYGYHATIRNSYATGSVNASNNVGGLVGNGNSSTITSSYSTGSVNGNKKVGGLVGYGYQATIRNSYATGSVTGSDTVGGLIGGGNAATYENVYYTDSTGQANGLGAGTPASGTVQQTTTEGLNSLIANGTLANGVITTVLGSNLPDLFDISIGTPQITYSNTASQKLTSNVTTTVTATLTTKLSDINGHDFGNGEIAVHKSDGTVETITISTTQTLGDFFDQISAYGFAGSIDSSGNLTITAPENSYFETITETTPTTITLTVTATADTTFAQLGVAYDAVATVYNKKNYEVDFITINSSDTIETFISKLNEYSITATMTDGRLELTSAEGNYIIGTIADVLNIQTLLTQVEGARSGSKSFTYSPGTALTNNTSVTGTAKVTSGQFKNAVSQIDTSSIRSISDDTYNSSTTIKISTAEELITLRDKLKNGDYDSSTRYFVLANDIDMTGISWDEGITTDWRHTFDGNGYTIKNLTGTTGLFNRNGGTITNLGTSGAVITESGGTSDSCNGILANYNNGNIENCFVVDSSITSSGVGVVGGLVGELWSGTITNSYTDVDITLTDTESSGIVAGAGGLVGYMYSSRIENSYSSGTMNDSSYGLRKFGGLVGQARHGVNNISNVFSDMTINNHNIDDVGGLIACASDTLSISNALFSGTIANNSDNSNNIIYEIETGSDVTISDIGCVPSSGSVTNLVCNWSAYVEDDDTLSKAGIESGNIVIRSADYTDTTVYIDATQTFSDLRELLANYDIELKHQAYITGTEYEFFSSSGNWILASSNNPNSLDYRFTMSTDYATVYSNTTTAEATYTSTITTPGSSSIVGSNLPDLFEITTGVASTTYANTTDGTTFYKTSTGAATTASKLEDIEFSDGSKFTFDASGNTSLVVSTTSKDGNTQTTTLNFSKTQTLNDVIQALAALGIQATIDSNGKFSLSSDSLNDFEISGDFGDKITGGGGKEFDISISLNTKNTTTTVGAATRDTLLSDLGVTTGEYYIYQNGVKNIAMISSTDTLGSFMDTLNSFGIQTSLIVDGTSSKLVAIGNGNSYIAKSDSVSNASNVVEKLFGTDSTDTKYNYSGMQELRTSVTTTSTATLDTLLRDFDTPWGGSTLKSRGILAFSVDGENKTIQITADETFGSLIDKLNAAGVEASFLDGKLYISDAHNFSINTAATTSSIINPNANIYLNHKDAIDGYMESSASITKTTTIIEEKTLSAASYANLNTKLSLLDISDGTFSVFRDGVKAEINVSSQDTFSDLQAKIAAKFSDVDLKFDDGKLVIYSKIGGVNIQAGTTTDTSNILSITGLSKAEDGSVQSARRLYCVNSDSVVMESGIFRKGNVTEGTFIVGNQEITINNKTTIADIASQINSSSETNATAFWDNIEGRFVIQSRTSGNALINIEAGTSNFTDILGLTESEWNTDGSIKNTRVDVSKQEMGSNARVSINGTYFTSASNVLTSDVTRINGLTINLKGLTNGSAVQIKVEKDKETAATTMDDVVNAYNELMENVDEAIAIDAPLHDQTVLKLMRNRLRSLMTSSVSSSALFKNLDSIGISVNSADANNLSTSNSSIINLSFNKDKFINALNTDTGAVKSLLVGDDLTKGVLVNVEELLENALKGVTGYFDSANSAYTREVEKIDNKITKANKAVERYKAQLEKKFSAMDMMIASIQQQYSSFLQ